MPERSRFTIIAEDPNFPPNITTLPIWPYLREYLIDGTAWWDDQMGEPEVVCRVHHPFLLPGHTGEGATYHRVFHTIFNHTGGDPDGAYEPLPAEVRRRISFIECLNVPTFIPQQGQPNILDASLIEGARGEGHFVTLAKLFLKNGGAKAKKSSKVTRTLFLSKSTADVLRGELAVIYPGVELIPEPQPALNPAAGPWIQAFPANDVRHRVVVHYHPSFFFQLPPAGQAAIRTGIREELLAP